MSSLFFEGDTEEECVAWVSALYDDQEFKDKAELIEAQVRAIMLTKSQTRPYPEFLPGSRTRVYLRDDIAYAFDIEQGLIFNVATKQILKASKLNTVSINGKMVLVHNEGLRACVPKPDLPNMSSDHIDKDYHNHTLKNMRWSTASLQAVNKHKHENRDTPAIEAKKDGGDWTFYQTRKAFVEEIGLMYDSNSVKRIADAVNHWKKFKGYNVRNWTPPDIGELRDIPPSVIGGAAGHKASERKGYIRRPNGCFTQGTKCSRSDYYHIGITGKTYKVHILTTNAFYGLKASEDMQANHKKGSANGPADAADLEWITPSKNTQHAHDTGLNAVSRAIVATLKDGSTQSFASSLDAVRWFKKEKDISLDNSSISKACNGKLKTHGGMTWAYADGTKESRKRKFIDDE